MLNQSETSFKQDKQDKVKAWRSLWTYWTAFEIPWTQALSFSIHLYVMKCLKMDVLVLGLCSLFWIDKNRPALVIPGKKEVVRSLKIVTTLPHTGSRCDNMAW